MPDINSDKVCFVIIKAREFDIQEELDVDDSNASDDHFMSVYADSKENSVRKELKEFIDSMDEDERCELVALCWIGRGDFSPKEWKIAPHPWSDLAASVQAVRRFRLAEYAKPSQNRAVRGASGECWLAVQADPSLGADQSAST